LSPLFRANIQPVSVCIIVAFQAAVEVGVGSSWRDRVILRVMTTKACVIFCHPLVNIRKVTHRRPMQPQVVLVCTTSQKKQA
jgi:hypothetical protein